MSFLSVFLGLNVAEYPKDAAGNTEWHLGYVSKYLCKNDAPQFSDCRLNSGSQLESQSPLLRRLFSRLSVSIESQGL